MFWMRNKIIFQYALLSGGLQETPFNADLELIALLDDLFSAVKSKCNARFPFEHLESLLCRHCN